MPEWKDTVNLPRTGFPMKANLQTAEPEALARGRPWICTARSARAGRARRSSCCTTAAIRERPDPPGARRSTRSSRTSSSSRGRWPATTRRSCRATTVTDCRSSCGWTASSGRRSARCRVADFRRACRAYAERFIGVMTRGVQRLMVFGHWDSSVPDDGLPVSGGYRAGAGGRSSSAASSTRERSRSTGASTAGPRWLKRKWSTRITSPSIYVEFPLAPPADRAGDAGSRRWPARGLGAHLDDDALDDPVEPGRRVSPRVRLRGVRASMAAR